MDKIKQALDRVESVFRAKPAAARFTKRGRATLKAGLLCEYSEEGKTIAADMPAAIGGGGEGLSPGGLARAALGTCLAIGYAMRAAQRGVALRHVAVEIEAEGDDAGLFGLPGTPYSEFRYRVHIDSEAPTSEIAALIDEADARSPVLHAIREAHRVVRRLDLTRTEAT